MGILELTIPIYSLNEKNIKAQYYRMALKYHPDKNNNSKYAERRFQEIGGAYTKLLEVVSGNDDELEIDDGDDAPSSMEIFEKFVKNNHLLFQLGVIMAEQLHHYLVKDPEKNADSDSDSDDDGETLYYTLRPTLEDLFNDKVLKLSVQDTEFLVPLWHNEMSYITQNGSKVTVNCVPQLPSSDMEIDECNNIICNVSTKLPSIQELSCADTPCINVNIGIHTYEIPYRHLYLTASNQVYTFHGRGIARIDEKDVYTTTNRGDIIINIVFV